MAGKAGMEGQVKRLSRRKMAGSNCVQVKGRVALKKPLARFPPPGKVVREKKVPPREGRILKNGWLVRKNSRNRGNRLRWLAKADREGDSLMGVNAE